MTEDKIVYTNKTNFTCHFFPVATSSRDEVTLAVSSLVRIKSTSYLLVHGVWPRPRMHNTADVIKRYNPAS